ncbi:MAG: serine/threonine protein kinase [Candidatus Obscuribacterales bacterium]|nr:serine/threonine protein kinase [Steroidobacteraceae bacterium]
MTTKAPPSGERRRVPRVSFPTILGYRFIQGIAISPHAEVHLAYSEELGHNVAVKLVRLHKHTEEGPSDADRFERERELLMRIRHRGVVDIYDWGSSNDFRYIVTEYFPAGSLELRVRNLLSTRDVVDIFVQIAGALRVVHTAGLAHRDLKPANVMLRADGTVVLIDFGLAKFIEEAVPFTTAGEIRGSPYYVSPEQALGNPVDQRSDLYSLGIILFEMLTGERPFKGSTVISILAAHQEDPIPRLPEKLATFQSLVDGLLAKDPAQRLVSADAALALMAKIKYK